MSQKATIQIETDELEPIVFTDNHWYPYKDPQLFMYAKYVLMRAYIDNGLTQISTTDIQYSDVNRYAVDLLHNT